MPSHDTKLKRAEIKRARLERASLEAERAALRRQAEFARALATRGLYCPDTEHESCGVGQIASLDGRARREVVERGIEALGALAHRGAVDADGKTGDGAGILVRVPREFFVDHIERAGRKIGDSMLAIGMVFLPREDITSQEACRALIEWEVIRRGHRSLGWRQVPIDVSVIGRRAEASRPEIEQIMIQNGRGLSEQEFENDLYIIRRCIENAARVRGIEDFYICSFSCRALVYKGLFLADQLSAFYPDLQNERFQSDVAVFHQRYSTNTFPKWWLAQPFRMLAHNGEINTLRGNLRWMEAHETIMQSSCFGDFMEELLPVVPSGSSDSAALDAVCEIMVRAGHHLPTVKSMLMPEAWENNQELPAKLRSFYRCASGIIEPWDGPAAICAVGDDWAIAGMDRNGLRPMRYVVTADKLLVVGSEVGVVKLDAQRVVERGHVGPGQLIGVDLSSGKFYNAEDMKTRLMAWGGKTVDDFEARIVSFPKRSASRAGATSKQNDRHGHDHPEHSHPEHRILDNDPERLRRWQRLADWSLEYIELILCPMLETAKEATGSMGDDVPLAVLSQLYRPLHHYFRQNFAQVTNPAIDSLRERHVMSLHTRLGNIGNMFALSAEENFDDDLAVTELESPMLLSDELAKLLEERRGKTINCCFPIENVKARTLHERVWQICRAAEDFARQGHSDIVLSDVAVDEHQAPVPMILAVGAVHNHLLRNGLRKLCSLHARSAECLDVHYFAVLIGLGATTVNPWLVEETVLDRAHRRLLADPSRALDNFREAVNAGLLKIMSKMGITVLSSYRGGGNFEAVGLSRALIHEFMPAVPSRISGIGISGLQKQILDHHRACFGSAVARLPVGGFYRERASGEKHSWNGQSVHMLQEAVGLNSYVLYKRYSESLDNPEWRVDLRHLLDFVPSPRQVGLDEVESVSEIRKRMVAPGISLGALSPIAHETLSIAMNRIGARSDSGEGGEDPARYKSKPNGDNASSAIKQIASGRFGVSAEYLNNCNEIEIKVAQGAKPGEGGQLPGIKVSSLIAKLRYSSEGVTLISPPPHHDIYSIEDLAQLIYDLKQINPRAKICVKLVAQVGVGTVASGVAKACADTILISGHSGGTGASPQSSIKYAGIPWEMGLSETHQVLSLNNLRDKVTLRTDGGIRTGRDIVVAALLGAEEYGIGTASLVAMGCLMVRQCHSNTCPVGICTQQEKLIEKFSGTPEKVINLFSFIAEEVREILAKLGVRSLEEIIGRTDLLRQAWRGGHMLDDLDLTPLLVQTNCARTPYPKARNPVPDTLDAQILKDGKALFEDGEKLELDYQISNKQRTVGTRTASEITRRFGMNSLARDHFVIKLRGTAGQSLGAWAVQGMKIVLKGEANDYVGKGLSGGIIVIRPSYQALERTQQDVIVGNTVLYGAIAGEFYAAGRAAERFAVRNSGASCVIEGCGANGCEYMTGGEALILGEVGPNFGAGMTGGMAFIYDAYDNLEARLNPETLTVHRLKSERFKAHVRAMIERHVAETGSPWGQYLLYEWEQEFKKIKHVIPREILALLGEQLAA